MRYGEAGELPAPPTSSLLVEAHWRLALVTMRLAGLLGCSGWPPRWSRSWTCYALVSMVVFAIVRVAVWCYMAADIFAKIHASPGDLGYYISTIYLINFHVKAIGVFLSQMTLICNSRGISLLVRAVYLSVHSHPRRRSETRNAVILCFGAGPLLYTIFTLFVMLNFPTSPMGWVFELCQDLSPVVVLSITTDSFMHMVVASVDLLRDVADGVQMHFDALPSVALAAPSQAPSVPLAVPSGVPSGVPGEPTGVCCTAKCVSHCCTRMQRGAQPLARGLRALRVRYQCVQDVVYATNRHYGFYNLVSSTITIADGVVLLYAGAIAVLGLLSEGGADADATAGMVWGVVVTAKLMFICGMGEQMRVEIQEFINQLQMQDIRFGAFDLIYFDLRTMNRVIATVMYFLVVVIQFSAILRRGTSSSSPATSTKTA